MLEKTLTIVALALAVLLAPGAALAQPVADRTSFSDHVHVGPDERVRDATSFSGDVVVEGEVLGDATSFGADVVVHGEVLGDATSFGGDVVLLDGASVHGDTTSMGGQVRDERGRGERNGDAPGASAEVRGGPSAAAQATPSGPLDGVWRWLEDTARSAVAHVLLFLLGLLLIGVSRERLGAMQATMIKDGLKTAGAGLLGYVAAVVTIVLLCLTIVGIPAAVLAGVLLPVASYVGLAAAATVIGAALPLPQLKGNEVAQLAAGVIVLFVASIVPFFGGIATAVAACLGFGALLRTRFKDTPPSDLPNGGGPYRDPTPAAS